MTKERLLAIYAQALDNCKPYVELSIETIKTEVGYILCTDWHNPKEAAKFLSLCPDDVEGSMDRTGHACYSDSGTAQADGTDSPQRP